LPSFFGGNGLLPSQLMNLLYFLQSYINATRVLLALSTANGVPSTANL